MTGAIDIRTGLRAVIAIAVLAAAFVVPAQAFANHNDCNNVQSDPTAAQYCPASDVLANNESGSNTSTSAAVPSGTEAVAATANSGSGSLPFTGLDVGTLVLAAAVLTGSGLVLRRLTASGAHKD